MIKNFNKYLVLSSFTMIFVSCIGLYPIDNKLEKENPEKIWHTFDFNEANVFQLRIEQTTEFLPVGIDSVVRDGKNQAINLVSDFPFKKFQQVKEKQKNYDNDIGNLVIEETYLYLDKFNTVQQDRTGASFGYAFYFITYPAIDKNKEVKRKVKYYNDSTKLYANIIRSVRIGYWMAKSNNEILLMFKNLDNKYSFYFGNHNKKIESDEVFENIEVKEISHPFNLSTKRMDEMDLLKFANKLKRTRVGVGPFKQYVELNLTEEDIEKAFNRIRNNTVRIQLKNVIDLEAEGLLFFNIPTNKKFIYEDCSEQETLKEIGNFSIGFSGIAKNKTKSHFYFGLVDGSGFKQYRFRGKVSFIDE